VIKSEETAKLFIRNGGLVPTITIVSYSLIDFGVKVWVTLRNNSFGSGEMERVKRTSSAK
jgi:hypothetical protein